MQADTLTKPSEEKLSNRNIYQQVTDLIIEQLESGTVPWQQPWDCKSSRLIGLPYNYTTGKQYQGINVLLLWGATIKNGFPSNEWAGFNQWSAKKETIRKGEKGTLVVYYDVMEKLIDEEVQKIPFLKSSYVFNRSQLSSFSANDLEQLQNTTILVNRIDEVEEFVENTGAIIQHHDDGAYYTRMEDKIMVPHRELFQSTLTNSATEGYYSTVLHELVHWSGAEPRLNRLNKKARFGDKSYANEELVAEFGAAFLCAGFGITTAEKGNHAAYIDHWLDVLKKDNRCIFHAASEASKAVDYLKKLQPVAA